MFHKSYLLKCIKSNDDHSFIEQHDCSHLFNNMDIKSESTLHNSTKKASTTSIRSKLKRKFNTSINKVIRKRSNLKKFKPSTFDQMTTTNASNVNNQSINSTIFSSTIIAANNTKISNLYLKSILDFSRNDYDDDFSDASSSFSDYEDDDEYSDDSFDTYYMAMNLTSSTLATSTMSKTRKLNSSMSSLSSIEAADSNNVLPRSINKRKILKKKSFNPMISSSKSNMTNMTSAKKPCLSFDPFTTSSRQSLFLVKNDTCVNHCSPVCSKSRRTNATSRYIENNAYTCSSESDNSLSITLTTSPNQSNYFNICSSTLRSMSTKSSCFKRHLINNKSISSLDSTNSSSSSSNVSLSLS